MFDDELGKIEAAKGDLNWRAQIALDKLARYSHSAGRRYTDAVEGFFRDPSAENAGVMVQAKLDLDGYQATFKQLQDEFDRVFGGK